ncbi:MAG: alpha/beta hydrolase [Flavobacteriaceae bacterium]|nr:alpha/beta hydrolase [Flavobacteriaceae bacterium]
MKKEKTTIYFVPGLAASSSIFEYLQLPENFEIILLEWLIPKSKTETLNSYAKRMSENIKHTNFILVGVSFGGIVVQEMSSYCKPLKVIIISSIKHENEFPKRLKTLRKTKTYKLAPINALVNIEKFTKYAFGNTVKKRIDLYKKYLAMRDKVYLSWAIHNLLHWKQTNKNPNIIHIHGNNDAVFPIKNIKNCIVVEGGTHAMILNKAKHISTILKKIC